MAEIAGLVLPFFGLIFIGFAIGKTVRHPPEALGFLNTFIVYVALPCLFFKLVGRTPLEQLTRWDFILADVGVTYAIFGLIFVLGYFVRKATIGEATIQSLAGAYGNIGYMGPGLALLAFGEAAAVPVALIFCFENMLHFIVAPALLEPRDTSGGARLALVATILKRIALHPFILATAAGFVAAATGFQAPLPLQRLIDMLAQAAAPCALFAMGVTLALRPLKRIPAEIIYIVPLKLIALPALMYAVLTLIGTFDPLWVHVAVLISALPTATNVFVLASHYGVWQERASAVILITTVASVLTVSGLLYLMKTGLI